MKAPHIRVVMPSRAIGKVSSARGAKFFITLPGEAEVRATWLTGATLHTDVDDVTRIDLRLLGSIEIEYEDGS